jgi:hypothetical protein
MSNKVTALVGGMLLVVALFAGTTQGCGGDGNDAVATCNQGCDKAAMCDPELAPFVAQCKSLCAMPAQGGQRCTNEAAIISAASACLKMTCETYLNCLEGVPECQGGGGGAGGGGGGSTGQGGTGGSGAGNCSICTKASACCTALGTGQDCSALNADSCAAAGANQATFIQGCQTIISIGMSGANPPAACQ